MATADKVSVSRAELVRVMREGAAASSRGEQPTACPFSPGARQADERVKAAAWLRGYVKAGGRPSS